MTEKKDNILCHPIENKTEKAKTLAEKTRERQTAGTGKRPMMEAMNSAGGGGVVGGTGMAYADSFDSSPRSRGADSWDEPFSSHPAVASTKLRLMCSYGGRIVPRPTDRSLCYLGGDTRIVVVERHTTLSDISAKLSRSLLGGSPFTLKYQLPNEDLDSLITVTTDEDLDNMIEEYDRIIASSSASGGSISSRSSRIRLFLFPSKTTESAPPSIGSLLHDSKSENWFVDALNGAISMDGLPRELSTNTSVDCLLDLEDNSSMHSRSGISAVTASSVSGVPLENARLVLPRPESSGKLARHALEVPSVPESPMVETSSSFGSTSSAPYLSNLPPIRVRPDDRPLEQRVGILEDQFSHLNISAAAGMGAVAAPSQKLSEEGGFKDANFLYHHPPTPTISSSAISPSQNPNDKTFFSDEDKSDQLAVNKPPYQQPQQSLQNLSHANALSTPESHVRPSYYPDMVSSVATIVNPNPDLKREVPVSGYALPTITQTDQQFRQLPAHAHQFQQQQQPQFIPANPNPQYIHHPAAGNVLQFPAYYQMPIQQPQQSHPYDQQQLPIYYFPIRQNPASQPYKMPISSLADVAPGPQGNPATVALPKAVPSIASVDVASAPPGNPASVALPKAIPSRPEQQPNPYRTAAVAPQSLQTSGTVLPAAMPPLIHIASDQGNPYSGMGYHVVHHRQPQVPPASAMPLAGNYGYEFVTDPTGNPSMYYAQTSSPPGVTQQYQTVVSSADAVAVAAATMQAGDGKQTKAT
ncbi:hypothetical protein HPP92_013707 [Vanilla planifolia]|uniref:PB1 domain-containing protein n=1 Tax=Vanilla planifolia TaxID=51239 RepID=A0A835QTK4_VANPL|nr:hypothetical protein HPP92_013707 [Vanilla planifolia]